MLTEKDLGLIGLGVRAGNVVIGSARVRELLKKDRLSLVVLAGDHSRRTEEKVGRLARGKGVRIIEGPSSAELGKRLGLEDVQAVGLLDRNLASGIGANGAVERS